MEEPLSPVSDGQDEFFDTLESLQHRRQASSNGFVEISQPSEQLPELLPRSETSPAKEKEVEDNTSNIIAVNTDSDDAVEVRQALQAGDKAAALQHLTTRERRQLLHRERQNARAALSKPEHNQLHRRSYELLRSTIESGYPASRGTDEHAAENRSRVAQHIILRDELGDSDRDQQQQSDKSRLLDDLDWNSQHNTPSRFTPSPLPRDTRDTKHAATRRRSLRADPTTLAALERKMDLAHGDDLFMQEAEDNNKGEGRVDRLLKKSAQQYKRRSLPTAEFRSFTSMDDRRPRTSGGTARPATRMEPMPPLPHAFARGGPGSVAPFAMEGVTIRSRRGSRYSLAAVEQQHVSPTSPRAIRVRSPDAMYGRLRPFAPAPASAVSRRTSQLIMRHHDSEGESPAESSEPKRSLPESTSADSQTAPSTVWDELDDLKSRIKKLELTGKLPLTSGAAMNSSPPMERPRTATTAPTTIDSSPKRERKSDEGKDGAEDYAQGMVNVQQSHPLLHAALAKAKSLLSPALYRSLEATAVDALHITALAGSTGAAFSPSVSMVNAGVSDRQLRRKADTMCRNLTDLCLALCDGKHENVALPHGIEAPAATAPGARLSRTVTRDDQEPRSSGRPLSRLEARRSSILGSSTAHSPVISPRRETDDLSTSEADTPSQYLSVDRRRFSRSSSRISTTRTSRYEDVSGDEEPTVRPPSRNGSEYSYRSKPDLSTREHQEASRRSFSLRDAMNLRRSSGATITGHRELSRVASMSSDINRRWTRESTPPVLEEEINEQEQHNPEPSPLPRQRMTSLGHFNKQRAMKETALRTSSLGRRAPQAMME